MLTNRGRRPPVIQIVLHFFAGMVVIQDMERTYIYGHLRSGFNLPLNQTDSLPNFKDLEGEFLE